MQALGRSYNLQPVYVTLFNQAPGIEEKHSTNLRLIVLIHSTFSGKNVCIPVCLCTYVNKLFLYNVAICHSDYMTKPQEDLC